MKKLNLNFVKTFVVVMSLTLVCMTASAAVVNNSNKEQAAKTTVYGNNQNNNCPHKLLRVYRSGNYVKCDYTMGAFQRGSYTVMRFADMNGRIYNEVAVNYNQDKYNGTVDIYCDGPQFKTNRYYVYFVVEGKVVDSKPIDLYYR